MRRAKLCLLLSSGLLACSGRYVTSSHDGAGADSGVDMGAASATGGSQATSGPPDATGARPTAVGGATSTPGSGPAPGGPPQTVTEAACGVPLGPPPVITAPINNGMMWWTRLSPLIWGSQPHQVPPTWTDSISYEQAGQIADDAIEQALAETKGVPGIEPFVRNLLSLQDPTRKLMVDWSRVLSKGNVVDSLLNLRFEPNRFGAFTEPDFLTDHSTISTRGVAMLAALFSQTAPPVPPGLPPFVPPAGLTRRQGLSQAVSAAQCASCHRFFDPLGFALENYDASGSYVTLDAGQPVDASGHYVLPISGGELEFTSFEGLARQLSDTCDVSLGLADHFLQFALRTDAPNAVIENQDLDRARLRQAFLRGNRTYRSLIRAFAQGYSIRAN